MSDEPKKYPADTPVTLQMLGQILYARHYPTAHAIIKSMIEPPRPEPKDGELWLCLIRASEDKIALWNTPDGWSVYQSGASEPWSTDEIMPLERLIPAEGSDE